jgi:hypothetical protein
MNGCGLSFAVRPSGDLQPVKLSCRKALATPELVALSLKALEVADLALLYIAKYVLVGQREGPRVLEIGELL